MANKWSNPPAGVLEVTEYTAGSKMVLLNPTPNNEIITVENLFASPGPIGEGNADSGTFSNLNATSGTFTGALSADSASLTTSLTAASGTFTGAISADSMTVTTSFTTLGDITAANVNVTSPGVVAADTGSFTTVDAGLGIFNALQLDNLDLIQGGLTSQTGTIDMFDDNLVTTGNITAGALLTMDAVDPTFYMVDSDAVVDEGRWRIQNSLSSFRIEARSDDDTFGQTALRIGRTSVGIDNFQIFSQVDITGETFVSDTLYADFQIVMGGTVGSGWASNYVPIQWTFASIYSITDVKELGTATNLYYDGTWRYRSTDAGLLQRSSILLLKWIWESATGGSFGAPVSSFETAMQLNRSGLLLVADTSNGNMTRGVTAQQYTADNEIYAAKSSDVNHALVRVTERDTFYFITKSVGAFGGTRIHSVMEDAASTQSLLFIADGGTAATGTPTSSATGLIHFLAREHDGADNFTDIAATGVVLTIAGRSGAADTTLAALTIEGDWHIKGNVVPNSLL